MSLVLGAVAGFIVGLAIAYVALIVLDRAGVTNFVEDEPLHGWPVFLAVIALVPSTGVIVGGVVGWKRLRPEREPTSQGAVD